MNSEQAIENGMEKRKLRLRSLVIALLMIALVAFVVREVRNHQNKTVAFAVVRELDGRIGSIPFEPIGTEYYISFRERDFSAEELQRLTVLHRLVGRNVVAVAFVDTNVTAEDVMNLRRQMPTVGIFRVVEGKTLSP